MLPFVVSMVLSQTVAAPVAQPPPKPAPAWGQPLTWKVGGKSAQAYVSPVLVAELSPSEEGAAAVKRADASAEVVAARPKVRLWRVRDAASVRAAVPALVVVVHDLPSTASRARVPVGVVCGGEKVAVRGLEALERAAREPGCLPDFWSVGFTR
jgi:hypothetical protein